MDPIETRRLRLRPLSSGDLRPLHRLYADPELMRYITGHPRSPWETKARLRSALESHSRFGFGLCASIWKASGEMIGRCGIERRARTDGAVDGELAWMFAQEWWGRGLGTETARALLRVGLHDLKLNRVFATADHGNLASIRIMQKVGMTFVREDDRGVEYESVRSASGGDG